jgi:hypothetical protein
MSQLSRKAKIVNLLQAANALAVQDQIDADISASISQHIETISQEIKSSIIGLELAAKSKKEFIHAMSGQRRLDFFNNFVDDYATGKFKPLITSFTSWEYPVLELFPCTAQYLPFAVAGEPLFVADFDNYILDNCSKIFNEYYSEKRLMKYKINGSDLSALPNNSFGFIYAINYLRFENEDFLLRLAANAYKLLLDGGVYLFSYNPLEMYWALEEVERGTAYGAYTEKLVSRLENIGFEVIKVFKENSFYSYVIVKKPGEIARIKTTGILGKIIEKEQDIMYNNETDRILHITLNQMRN